MDNNKIIDQCWQQTYISNINRLRFPPYQTNISIYEDMYREGFKDRQETLVSSLRSIFCVNSKDCKMGRLCANCAKIQEVAEK